MLTPKDKEMLEEMASYMFGYMTNKVLLGEEYYINEKDFRELIGLGVTQFYKLKKIGKFNKAMHPATKGGKRVKYHKFFNRHSQKIELPGV
ncbi:MAG: hypothetical protein LBC64_02390 [Fibromonadaceae bacterium]|jgi:hypothetical protein|nr:hypothetical protein [Fibromonadaceae bacterium]